MVKINVKIKFSNGNFQPSSFDIIEKFTSGDFWQKDQKNRVALNALWVMKMQIQTLPKVGGGRIWNT